MHSSSSTPKLLHQKSSLRKYAAFTAIHRRQPKRCLLKPTCTLQSLHLRCCKSALCLHNMKDVQRVPVLLQLLLRVPCPLLQNRTVQHTSKPPHNPRTPPCVQHNDCRLTRCIHRQHHLAAAPLAKAHLRQAAALDSTCCCTATQQLASAYLFLSCRACNGSLPCCSPHSNI